VGGEVVGGEEEREEGGGGTVGQIFDLGGLRAVSLITLSKLMASFYNSKR
jgi:hypothetical protein